MSRGIRISIGKEAIVHAVEEPANLFLRSWSNHAEQEINVQDALAENGSAIAPIVHLQLRSEPYQLRHEVINAGLLRFRSYTQSQMEEIWNSYKLHTDSVLNDERLYFVQCIDLHLLCYRRVDQHLKPLSEAYSVQRDEHGYIAPVQEELSEHILRAIEINAARALYALWLDIGSVLVAVSGTGSIAVRKAWSIESTELPFQRDVLNQALTEWLSRWQTDDKNELMLGADPELLIVDEQHKLVKASELLLNVNSEEIGIDAIMYRGHIIHPIVELRPYPVQHPLQLVKRIYRLLKELNQYIEGIKLKLLAGAMPKRGMSLGGHLHISGAVLTPRLLRLLDVMLALPFSLLSDTNGKLRNRKYGGLGDFRKQFHGGFEYRTLPSWLVSPALAQAAIVSCWLIVQHRKALAEQLTPVNAADDLSQMLRSYELGAEEERYELAKSNIQLLMKAGVDPSLSERLKPLQRALEQHRTWDESQDIRVRWKLPTASEPASI